jgi:predicted RNA binding protein YcfA (HicA-like mRNA interferase family)
MDILNILYTPVEIPEPPMFDRKKLKEWCALNINQDLKNRKDGKLITSEDIYPWNIVYARRHHQWIGGFEKIFPELSEYFCKSYQLLESELDAVVILPVKPEFTGAKYWHADPDDIGLRLYLENDDCDRDFLLIKPTVYPYNSREELGNIPENGITEKVQDKIYSAKILRQTQGFYLNNVRGIHTVNVTHTNSKRMTVLIMAKNVPQRTKDLIISSAIKYPELSITWSNG